MGRTVGPVGDPETIGWWERLWGPFWVLPSMICALAVAAGLLLPRIEAALTDDLPYLFGGGAESARSLLSTIASAMISVTGLVFSITMVVMQLASSQFTPRLLGSFLSSRITQVTLGVFTSSFVFALIVLRDVRGGDEPFVPRWLSPDHPGVLGYYIGILVRWLILLPPAPYGIVLADFPYLKAVLAAHEARPAALRVAASDGLGPTPFTNPGS